MLHDGSVSSGHFAPLETSAKAEGPTLFWGDPRAHQPEQNPSKELLPDRQERGGAQVAKGNPMLLLWEQHCSTLPSRRRPFRRAVADQGFKGIP